MIKHVEAYEGVNLNDEPESTLIPLDDAEPAEAIELPPRYMIKELRDRVADLAEQIQTREATIAEYRADLEQSKATLAGARLGDNEEALARVQVHADLLEKEMRRLNSELPVRRYEHDKLSTELGNQENRLGMARYFIERAHSGGLAVLDQHMTIGEARRKYQRSLAILAAAGESVEAQAVTVGEVHHYVGGSEPPKGA